MKNKRFFYLFISFLYLIQIDVSYSHVKSASIEKLRRNTKGVSLDFPIVVDVLYYTSGSTLYNYSYKTGYIYKLNNFNIFFTGGHFYVVNELLKVNYDSSGGQNGTIRQKYNDCLLHSTNNILILEQIG